eukprot:scaffold661416_cov75-Attheya_sp.AAC.1
MPRGCIGPICTCVYCTKKSLDNVARQHLSALRNVRNLTGRYTKRSVPSEAANKPKSLPLMWEQVEAHQ